jgi:SIR2-like domain
MATGQSDAFFHRAETKELIETIAVADRLTIFAGAGVSRDRGSPDWEQLVHGLLNDRIRESPAFHEVRRQVSDRDAFVSDIADRFLAAIGTPATASAVRHIFERDEHDPDDLIQRKIHDLLYHDWAPGGPLSATIAELAAMWRLSGKDVAIVTTNYDDNIETSFRDLEPLRELLAERGVEVVAVTSEREVGENVIPVYHLHGYVPRTGTPDGPLVLCERDFARDASPEDWRKELLAERLTETTCLFVGSSLQDPTLVRNLVATAATATVGRYAALAVQGEAWLATSEPLPTTLQMLTDFRLRHLGVTAIRTDFFGQISQLLHEIHVCQAAGPGSYQDDDSPIRYGRRLKRWEQEWRGVVARRTEQAIQEHHYRELLKVRDRLLDEVKPDGDELVKVELWIRDPEARQLVLWSSSEAVWRNRKSLHRGDIIHQSPYISVQAFCFGHVYRPKPEDVPPGRWRNFVSTPVVLGEEWSQLPVGVVTIASTGPALEKMGNRVLAHVATELHTVGSALLDPQRL